MRPSNPCKHSSKVSSSQNMLKLFDLSVLFEFFCSIYQKELDNEIEIYRQKTDNYKQISNIELKMLKESKTLKVTLLNYDQEIFLKFSDLNNIKGKAYFYMPHERLLLKNILFYIKLRMRKSPKKWLRMKKTKHWRNSSNNSIRTTPRSQFCVISSCH